MSVVMFRGKNGEIFTQNDIENAFSLMTGKFHDRYGTGKESNHGEYCRFLNNLFGNGISEWFVPTVDDLIMDNRKVLAIKLYHDENKCSFSEAKDFVEKRIKELEYTYSIKKDV